ncbi:hypothetical protein BH24BAC1_BH24BAC1_07480 [soil metagenome]
MKFTKTFHLIQSIIHSYSSRSGREERKKNSPTNVAEEQGWL